MINAALELLQLLWLVPALPLIAYHGRQTGKNDDNPEVRQHHIDAARWHMDGGPFRTVDRTSIIGAAPGNDGNGRGDVAGSSAGSNA